MMKEIKPVVAEKCQFGYGAEPKWLAELEPSNCQISEAPNKINEIIIESPDASLNLSSEVLMKEIKLVVMENHEFDNRDESILIAVFGIFGLSGL